MSEEVKQGDQVEILYTGKLKDGSVFDQSEPGANFQFTAGGVEVIPGMSEAVVGMKKGDAKTIEIEPDRAYGDYDGEMVVKIERNQIPDDVSVGDALSDGSEQGPIWIVKELGDDFGVLDGNHPLAGETLIFDIELVGITSA